jgi:hypothetical protein
MSVKQIQWSKYVYGISTGHPLGTPLGLSHPSHQIKSSRCSVGYIFQQHMYLHFVSPHTFEIYLLFM